MDFDLLHLLSQRRDTVAHLVRGPGSLSNLVIIIYPHAARCVNGAQTPFSFGSWARSLRTDWTSGWERDTYFLLPGRTGLFRLLFLLLHAWLPVKVNDPSCGDAMLLFPQKGSSPVLQGPPSVSSHGLLPAISSSSGVCIPPFSPRSYCERCPTQVSGLEDSFSRGAMSFRVWEEAGI